MHSSLVVAVVVVLQPYEEACLGALPSLLLQKEEEGHHLVRREGSKNGGEADRGGGREGWGGRGEGGEEA